MDSLIMILIHWSLFVLGGSGVACGESSGGTGGVDEEEVGFVFGFEIFTLDFDFLGEEGFG